MIHYRIIGSIWLLFGVIGLALGVLECLRILHMGLSMTDGEFVSTFIGSGFCAFAAATAVGLFRASRWGRIVVSILAVLLGLYLLSFLAMVGLGFGPLAYAASWLGLAFVAYTLTVIRMIRPH
jgi:hypothetical protein